MKKLNQEERKIHKNFQEYGSNARLWMRKCVIMLPQIEDHRIWEKKGYASLSHYAAVLAGMSQQTCWDGLRILKRTSGMIHIRALIEKRGINIVRPIETILNVENEEFWAEKASKMGRNTLEAYVREFRKLNEKTCLKTTQNLENPQTEAISNFENSTIQNLNFQTIAAEPTIKQTVMMQLEPEVLEQLEKLKGKGEWNDLLKQLLQLRAKNLEETKPEKVETDSRHIPNKIQRFVEERDNGQCAFPGCKNPIAIHHHTDRFGLKKEHDPNTIYGLCTAHERIAHLGLIENEHLPPANWKIRTEPDRTSPKFGIDLLVQRRRAPGL